MVSRDARHAPALDLRVVRRRAERMLDELGIGDAELSIVLTDDERIAALNAAHRKKPRATDVLAFPMDEAGTGPSGGLRLLGDVVISLDTAQRQARSRRKDLLEEVTQLLAHGLLHLVGHDHRTLAEEQRMNSVAERLVLAVTRRSAPRRTFLRRLRDRG